MGRIASALVVMLILFVSAATPVLGQAQPSVGYHSSLITLKNDQAQILGQGSLVTSVGAYCGNSLVYDFSVIGYQVIVNSDTDPPTVMYGDVIGEFVGPISVSAASQLASKTVNSSGFIDYCARQQRVAAQQAAEYAAARQDPVTLASDNLCDAGVGGIQGEYFRQYYSSRGLPCDWVAGYYLYQKLFPRIDD